MEPDHDFTVDKTITLAPAPSLTGAAMKNANVPLDGFLKLNDNGTFSVNPDAGDLGKCISALTGAILELHAIKTMVLPSNSGRLDDVLVYLRGKRASAAEEHRSFYEHLIEDIESVQKNLNFDN